MKVIVKGTPLRHLAGDFIAAPEMDVSRMSDLQLYTALERLHERIGKPTDPEEMDRAMRALQRLYDERDRRQRSPRRSMS